MADNVAAAAVLEVGGVLEVGREEVRTFLKFRIISVTGLQNDLAYNTDGPEGKRKCSQRVVQLTSSDYFDVFATT